MKTVAYLQIVPKFDRSGKVIGIRPCRVSTKNPTEPVAGALTLKLNITVPDVAFKPIQVDISVPESAVTHKATVELDQGAT